MNIVTEYQNEQKLPLSEKSKHTLDLLMQGLSAKEIADKQNRTRDAVETHMERLRRQYAAKNTVHLIAMYVKGEIAA